MYSNILSLFFYIGEQELDSLELEFWSFTGESMKPYFKGDVLGKLRFIWLSKWLES